MYVPASHINTHHHSQPSAPSCRCFYTQNSYLLLHLDSHVKGSFLPLLLLHLHLHTERSLTTPPWQSYSTLTVMSKASIAPAHAHRTLSLFLLLHLDSHVKGVVTFYACSHGISRKDCCYTLGRTSDDHVTFLQREDVRDVFH